MRMTDAITKRKQIKAKKPVFLAQDTHKKKRIRQRWRRPRGLQSKIRLNKRGYRRGVSSGWRSPIAARGLSPEGLIPVRIETLAQLEALDAKTQGAMVSGRVSIRTKKILYDAAAKKKVTVLNRDAKLFEERYAAKMAERESRKKQLEAKRERQEKLKKDIEKTQESGVAAEGLKKGSGDSETKSAEKPASAQKDDSAKKAAASTDAASEKKEPSKAAPAQKTESAAKKDAPASEKKDAPEKKDAASSEKKADASADEKPTKKEGSQ